MRARALPIVLALAAADYLVWIWATTGQQSVPAVVTGLALPPLAIALAWITLLTLVAGVRRAAGELGRRTRARSAARKPGARSGPGSGRRAKRAIRRRIAA
jgi:hypothetical protein